MLKILYKSKDTVVIIKPIGLSSLPDEDSTSDAMTELSKSLKGEGEPNALYPIHRLDKVVSGLLVFARSKESAARLSKLVCGEGLGKEYFAVVEGVCPEGEMRDYLKKSKLSGKAEIAKSESSEAKLALLEAMPIASVECEAGKRTLVKIKLITGRFHQIRAQLSSRGCPIVGDKKYGAKDYLRRTPALFSYKLEIPDLGKTVRLCAEPELSEYPWNLFAPELYRIDMKG